MVLTMQSCKGIEVECHHHEVASGGQTEIDLKFDSLLRAAWSSPFQLLREKRLQERSVLP